MNGVAGVDNELDLIGLAVNQCDLTCVAQRDGKQIIQIPVVLLFLWPLVDRHTHFPGLLHVGQAEFRRGRRVLEDEPGHQVDLVLGQFTRRAPVRHARRRAVGDKGLEMLQPQLPRDIRCERLACRTFAQNAVTASAALKIDALRLVEFLGRHDWNARLDPRLLIGDLLAWSTWRGHGAQGMAFLILCEASVW